MQFLRSSYRLLAVVAVLVGLHQASAQDSLMNMEASLDNYIAQGMRDWDIPGLAVAVVKDGKVVKLQGYGVADLAKGTPVTPETHFFIASNTKLFTGLALANLGTQGKLQLDDPVVKYIPYFKHYDSLLTPQVSIRDMLSHRIGLKTFQGDFTFWNTSLTSNQIIGRMRLLKPSKPFRKAFGYCNSCFMVAGEVVPRVTGKSWANYITDSLLVPLGMMATYAKSNGIETRLSTMATPYTTNYTGKPTALPYDTWDNLGPAASIVSHAADMVKWLQFHLDSGKVNGRQLIPWAAMAETRRINTPFGPVDKPSKDAGYGLGLEIESFRGRQIFSHTGGAGGMVSALAIVPQDKLGILVLTNNDHQQFFVALRQQIIDFYTGEPFINRSREGLNAFKETMRQQLDQQAQWQKKVGSEKPELPLSDYALSYKNPVYGAIEVNEAGDHLKIKFLLHPHMTATLKYMSQGEWLLEYSNPLYGVFAIKFDVEGGEVKRFALPFNNFVEYDPYVFERIF